MSKFKIFLIFPLLFLLSACSNNNSNTKIKSKENMTQVEFCKIISDYRNAYFSEKINDFYIDQKTELEKIYSKREESLKSVLKNGYVENWEATISEILVSENRGAFLEVKLSCGASIEEKDNLNIAIDSPIYQSLRYYSENSKIKFSGHFLVPTDKSIEGKYPYETYYGEKSFTREGSIKEPEFLFKFTSFHN